MALYAAGAAATTATALDPMRCHSAKRWRVSMQFFSGNDREGRAAVPVIVSLLEVESHSRTDGRVELQHIEFQFA